MKCISNRRCFILETASNKCSLGCYQSWVTGLNNKHLQKPQRGKDWIFIVTFCALTWIFFLKSDVK